MSNEPAASQRGRSVADAIIVSTVATATATTTQDTNVFALLNDIKGGRWKDSVQPIREEYSRAVSEDQDPKAAVSSLKKKLPGVMWSGRFKSRKKPVAEKLLFHSG